MSEDDERFEPSTDERPPVACTISEERAEERAEWMTEDLVPAYAGAEEREDSVTVCFEGADDTLQHVARFVAEEKECCSFADYRVDVSPPYDETRLTIMGPEGTKEMFAHEFVERLEGVAARIGNDPRRSQDHSPYVATTSSTSSSVVRHDLARSTRPIERR